MWWTWCLMQTSLLYRNIHVASLIARFMGPTLGPSGADRTQEGPLLAPRTLLSGIIHTEVNRSGIINLSDGYSWQDCGLGFCGTISSNLSFGSQGNVYCFWRFLWKEYRWSWSQWMHVRCTHHWAWRGRCYFCDTAVWYWCCMNCKEIPKTFSPWVVDIK